MKTRSLLTQFGKALVQLECALEQKNVDDLQKAGCIQYFEFTFELAWKTARAVLTDLGAQKLSYPKEVLLEMYKKGWITHESRWLGMLGARNAMSHTYDQYHALDVFEELPVFLMLLRELYLKLQQMAK